MQRPQPLQRSIFREAERFLPGWLAPPNALESECRGWPAPETNARSTLVLDAVGDLTSALERRISARPRSFCCFDVVHNVPTTRRRTA